MVWRSVFRVQMLALLFVLGLGGLIVRETRYDNPLINFRTLKDRNFLICCIIIFCAFATLYANTVSLPALLQSLFGYDATTSGLVLSPAGIFAIIMLAHRWPLARSRRRCTLSHGRRVFFVLGVGGYWMSRLNLEISPWQIVWPRVVFIWASPPFLLRSTLPRSCTFQRTSRRRGRFACAFAQRGRQRRDLGRSNNSGTARSISQLATRRKSRSAQSGRKFLPRSSPARFSSANRRPGGRQTNGATKSREFT